MIFRIKRRVTEQCCALALAQYLDTQLASRCGKFWLHIADRKALAEDVPVVTGGGAADDRTASVKERLISQWVSIADVVHLERNETVRYTACALLLKRLFADERTLVHTHEPIEARLKGRVVGGHVAAPHAVGLLHA